jgi:hypothetical protein
VLENGVWHVDATMPLGGARCRAVESKIDHERMSAERNVTGARILVLLVKDQSAKMAIGPHPVIKVCTGKVD